jgi:hypothetical protein
MSPSRHVLVPQLLKDSKRQFGKQLKRSSRSSAVDRLPKEDREDLLAIYREILEDEPPNVIEQVRRLPSLKKALELTG